MNDLHTEAPSSDLGEDRSDRPVFGACLLSRVPPERLFLLAQAVWLSGGPYGLLEAVTLVAEQCRTCCCPKRTTCSVRKYRCVVSHRIQSVDHSEPMHYPTSNDHFCAPLHVQSWAHTIHVDPFWFNKNINLPRKHINSAS